MYFVTFYTMPKMEDLKDLTSFDSETKILSWDFNGFFEQACTNNELTNIKVTLTQGNVMELLSLVGSKKISSDCLNLQVAYDKQETKWRRNVTVFNEFVSDVSWS